MSPQGYSKVGWPLGMEIIYTAVLDPEIDNNNRETVGNLTVRVPLHVQDT